MDSFTISHTDNALTVTRADIHLLGRHLAHILPSRDWQVLVHARVFQEDLPGAVFFLEHSPAQIAAALRAALDHRLMPRTFVALTRQLADAADRATAARETWCWD
jgi:hypothetical protein